ncbi:MAG: hypothetical protein R3C44_15385 [Chloroflexota bacterium]
MKYRILILVALVTTLLVACDNQIGDYVSASSISRNGFARNAAEIRELNGEEVKLWGYVDYGNLYGDESARSILGDLWSGEGPDADTWRFNLKTSADSEVGQSFAVYVPNDAGRDELLQAFVADAAAGQPTQVFVTGKIFADDAPTNTADLTALHMELDSSDAVQLEPPEGGQ